MAGYTLERFGAIALPLYNREIEYGPIPARPAIVQTLAGAFDNDGDGDASMQLPYTLPFRATVLETTVGAWRTTLDALRAVVRTRAKLYRRGEDDDTSQWCRARLVSANMQRGQGNILHIEVALNFQVLTPWVGHDHNTWTFDDGEYFDAGLYFDEAGFTETMASSPHTITVINGGNRRVDNAVIRITAGASAITALTIAKTGETDIDYSASIVSSEVLVIDCGAYSVVNDGVSDYDNLDLASSHVIAEWLRLDPGDNDIIITFSGGSTNSTVTIEFVDGWA